MGFWNKLGKIALQAAPYVAAPFTGGASLAFTPATQKLGQKWAEADAKKAIAKGLAPSKFDKYLGMASGVASMASGAGLLGKGMSMAGGGGTKQQPVANAATQLGGWQGKLGKIGDVTSMATTGRTYAGDRARLEGNVEPGGMGGWQGQLGGIIASQLGGNNGVDGSANDPRARQPVGTAAPRGGSSIGNALMAGRREALINQPFRGGYQTVVQGDDDTTLTHDMPAIYPNYSRDTGQEVISPPVSENGPTPIQNRFNDELTPRARRRYPANLEAE